LADSRRNPARSAAAAAVESNRHSPEQTPDHRLERLIERLPDSWRAAVRWLRRPSSRWVRIPAGVLLIAGSVLSILPFFGLWMLPLGLFLLAEDLPPLRRARDRLMDWIARRRPHWVAADENATAARAAAKATHRPVITNRRPKGTES
jgi:hypothetical protein